MRKEFVFIPGNMELDIVYAPCPRYLESPTIDIIIVYLIKNAILCNKVIYNIKFSKDQIQLIHSNKNVIISQAMQFRIL